MRRLLTTLAVAACSAWAQVRVKDVADVQGVSVQRLVGYGLVMGLSGTGDSPNSAATTQSTANLLRNMGLEVDPTQLRLRNVASVILTADLPAFAKPGQRIDVQASSLGDARSLTGGVLLMAPLKGADGEIYALAQGSVGTGGAVSQNFSGASLQQNHGSSGILPRGGIVQRENVASRLDDGPLRLTLRDPDFSSAEALAQAIDKQFGAGSALAEDAATVKFLGKDPEGGRTELVAQIENLRFEPSRTARVVVNERTGTIVAGSDVRIAEVAVTQGSLTIRVDPNWQVSQPAAFSKGTTQVVANPKIQATEPKSQMQVLPANTSVGDLARTLNSLGATPRDLVAILQAIQKSGALQAELVLM
ncbi:MAG TPA: flagellar basal body P-ring protein FlgI [Fibrobacteria bacterium]|nr:flagellar basal body P-ring protein FlgI [Fibrobacteria bacterium]